MNYVDGFLLPVPVENLQAYARMSQKAGKIWREHGALEYRECAGDALDVKFGVSFSKTIKLKPGESATAEEVRAFCGGQISRYKIPRYVKFVDGFPMTVTGKVQKFLMRETSVAELGLEKAAAVRMA